MSDEISWCVELAVKPGRLEAFKELTAEMVLATRNEPGALAYQRFITADGGIVHAFERYADSAAAAAHLETFRQKFGERFSALVERRRF